jgi:hypothetical protein
MVLDLDFTHLEEEDKKPLPMNINECFYGVIKLFIWSELDETDFSQTGYLQMIDWLPNLKELIFCSFITVFDWIWEIN